MPCDMEFGKRFSCNIGESVGASGKRGMSEVFLKSTWILLLGFTVKGFQPFLDPVKSDLSPLSPWLSWHPS